MDRDNAPASDTEVQQIIEKEQKKFTEKFAAAFKRIEKLLGHGSFDIQPSYAPFSNKQNYYFQAIGQIEHALPVFLLTWNPRTGELNRSAIELEGNRGKGLGTKITEICVDLARELDAERFSASGIVNPDWQQNLLQKQGFLQDPISRNKVFKLL